MDFDDTKKFLHVTYAPEEPCDESERIDAVLTRLYPDYSRSYFQRIIDQQAILINNSVVKKSSIVVKAGDIISVCFPQTVLPNLEPLQVDFDVIDIQDDFIVIYKPAGLSVHPSPTADAAAPTLVNGLLYRFKELGSSFADLERPGIVHRLDKDTTGLLIIARNERACAKISTMFVNRQIHKTYLALVIGHPLQRQGSIDFDIGRDPVERHKMSHRGICSRSALTHYKVLAYYNEPKPATKNVPLSQQGSALVELNIITGRTHQIRVHMAAIGHWLLGDAVYGKPSDLIARQALHAHKISFEYNGQQYVYEQSLPADMQTLVDGFTEVEKA